MKTPLRVLIVEDSEDDALLLVRQLRRAGYDLTFERVETQEALDAVLTQQAWDIVIADYAMPRFSAPAALSLLQRRGVDLPFIIVSGRIDEETAVDALKAGAHDFIVKGNMVRLVPAVQRELRESEERRARRSAERALHKSDARLRAVMDNVADGIVTTDERGVVESCNPAAERLFGYASGEIVSQDIRVLILDPHHGEILAPGWDSPAIAQDTFMLLRRQEVVGRRKDGTTSLTSSFR